jgi:hypothetical protein
MVSPLNTLALFRECRGVIRKGGIMKDLVKLGEMVNDLVVDFKLRTGIMKQTAVRAIAWKALKSCKDDQRKLNRIKSDIQDYLVEIKCCQVGDELKEVSNE